MIILKQETAPIFFESGFSQNKPVYIVNEQLILFEFYPQYMRQSRLWGNCDEEKRLKLEPDEKYSFSSCSEECQLITVLEQCGCRLYYVDEARLNNTGISHSILSSEA
jgi:hypothetical protein